MIAAVKESKVVGKIGEWAIKTSIENTRLSTRTHPCSILFILISYGWSLDCSWLDITDLAPGIYVLVIETNPARVFPEVSFDNNKQSVVVTIPAVEGIVDVAMKLETAKFKKTNNGSSAAPETFPTTHALLMMAIVVLGTLTL
jgi:hypothetical protein